VLSLRVNGRTLSMARQNIKAEKIPRFCCTRGCTALQHGATVVVQLQQLTNVVGNCKEKVDFEQGPTRSALSSSMKCGSVGTFLYITISCVGHFPSSPVCLVLAHAYAHGDVHTRACAAVQHGVHKCCTATTALWCRRKIWNIDFEQGSSGVICAHWLQRF
jgi:hypothetical protein